MSGHHHNVTRGYGFLEGHLARKRAGQANSLILQSARKGRGLDIGCGTFPHFLMNTNFKEKFGIDSSLSEKVKEVKGIKLLKTHIQKKKLPFEDNFFDTVVMLAVFEHIEFDNIPFLLHEIKRILKKNGQFIITTPSPLAVWPLLILSHTGFISKVEIEDHKHALEKSYITDVLMQAGFSQKNTKSGYFEFGMNMWFDVRK